jgi:CRISPR-associated protein Cas1
MAEILSNPNKQAETSADWFLTATGMEFLEKGWDKVCENGGGPGGDGVSIGQFARDARRNLTALSASLRGGGYRPSPARRVFVPKSDGTARPLDIPAVADRIVQAAVALFLQPHFEAEFEDESFGYRPGRGVRDAIRRVVRHRREGFTHVVDADIRKFFESVPHGPLVARLEESVPDRRLVDLIWSWLEWYRPEGRGLPQGSPLSPALANLYLDRVDERIAGSGVRLVRYADDFVLLCRSEGKAEAALAKARELLAEAGLEIHDDKTRVVSFEQGFRFLGHVFVRSLAFKETALDEVPGEDALAAMQSAFRGAEAERKAQKARAAADPAGAASGSGRPDLSLSRRWRTLYVLEPGRRLAAAGEAFTVMEENKALIGLPAAKVGRIETGAGVAIGTEALELAAAHDVEIVRIDGFGAPIGRWLPAGVSHARRHMAQFRAAADPQRRLAAARAIVAARIFNQATLLKRLGRYGARLAEPAAFVRFRRLERRALFETDIGRLMGWEGEAGSLFWPALSAWLPEPWRFPARARHPATGMGEVALNVAAGLLARDIAVALRRRDLHPGVGFLHTERNDGEALVHDLMEEFRAPVMEAGIMAAIRRGQLVPAMFRRSGEAGWFVDRDGYRAIVRAHETIANRPIRDPVDGDTTTWRGLFERQAERVARFCETGEPYRPYRMDY